MGNLKEELYDSFSLCRKKEKELNFIELTDDLIQISDISDKLIYVNKSWKNSLEYNEEDLSNIQLLDLVQSEDKASFKELINKMKEKESVMNFESVIISKSKEKKFIEGRLISRFKSGSFCNLIAILKDITKNRIDREELKKLSKIYEQSQSLIILTDPNGKIEYVNPKFLEVTGFSKEEVVGMNPRIIQSGETKKEKYKELWDTIKSKKTWNGRLLNKKKNGERYFASVSISPILDDYGKIVNFMGIQEDITLNIKSEEELKLFNKMAIERELKMIELKKEVNSLLGRLGEKPKYI